MIIDQQYWENRWLNADTPWDIGEAAPAICNYIDQCTDKQLKILIPGCGNAHEAAYLIQQGFLNVTLLDIAENAIILLKDKFKSIDALKVVHGDFFNHHEKYDLIIEQTFFCALEPKYRLAYVQQMKNLLNPAGKLIGLWFNRTFEQSGPPFGGSELEYRKLFSNDFTIEKMENTSLSIAPRKNVELFVVLKMKN